MIETGVQAFEPNHHTCLATDWSKTGLGFVLLQKHCRCAMADAPNCCNEGWRLILAGSRFTTEQSRDMLQLKVKPLLCPYALEKMPNVYPRMV